MKSASAWMLRSLSRLSRGVRQSFRPTLFKATTFAATGVCLAGTIYGLNQERPHTIYASSAPSPTAEIKGEEMLHLSPAIAFHIEFDSRSRFQREDAAAQEKLIRSLMSQHPPSQIQLMDISLDSKNSPISEKDTATAYMLMNSSLRKIKLPRDPALVPGFVRRKCEVLRAGSVFDAAEFLKESNRGLFDSAVVFYCSDRRWAKYLNDPIRKKTIEHLLRLNTGVLRVPNKKLAKKLGLKKTLFYRYYKPSFVSGYANTYGLNAEYWQLVEKECRDVLTPNRAEIEKTSPENATGLFKSSEDVEFHFSKSYRKLLAQPRQGRSIVYIYWDKNAIIWPFMDQITKFARKYDCECDFVFSSDLRKSSKYFNMGDVEENLPYVFIVDPDKLIPIKNPISQEMAGGYRAVYSDIVLLMLGLDEGSKFVESFFEGKLKHVPQSKRMARPSLVKRINKESFESDFLNNDAVEQCIIQIYKHNCASCYYNSKSFDALSWKLKKYGLDDRLKLYKMHNDNDVPQLGTFPFTPMYIYVRKGKEETKGQIVELATLESLQKFDLFKSQLEKLSGLDLSKIVIDPKAQFEKYIKKEDKAEGFDFDFDAAIVPKPDDTTKEEIKETAKEPVINMQETTNKETKQLLNRGNDQ